MGCPPCFRWRRLTLAFLIVVSAGVASTFWFHINLGPVRWTVRLATGTASTHHHQGRSGASKKNKTTAKQLPHDAKTWVASVLDGSTPCLSFSLSNFEHVCSNLKKLTASELSNSVSEEAVTERIHDFFEVSLRGIQDLFKITLNEYSKQMSALVDTNIGERARMTLCRAGDHAVWIVASGHFRTFRANIQNFRSFLGLSPDSPGFDPCRFVVIFTRPEAEAVGTSWWGNRNAEQHNSKIEVVSTLKTLERQFQSTNFFWVVARSRKRDRLHDMELLSYLYAKRLKTFHDAIHWRYEEATNGKAPSAGFIIMGPDWNTSQHQEVVETRKGIFLQILCDLLQSPNTTSSLRHAPRNLINESITLQKLHTYCPARTWQSISVVNGNRTRLEHIFIRTRPDILYDCQVKFGQITDSMRNFRNLFGQKQVQRIRQSAPSNGNPVVTTHSTASHDPEIFLGFFLLHWSDKFAHGFDPSEVFFMGTEALFDTIFGVMVSTKGWPNLIWPNLVFGPSETLKKNKQRAIGGLFVIPPAFHAAMHRLKDGTVQPLNIGPIAVSGTEALLRGDMREVVDFTRNVRRIQKISKKIDLKYFFDMVKLPTFLENLTEPGLNITLS